MASSEALELKCVRQKENNAREEAGGTSVQERGRGLKWDSRQRLLEILKTKSFVWWLCAALTAGFTGVNSSLLLPPSKVQVPFDERKNKMDAYIPCIDETVRIRESLKTDLLTKAPVQMWKSWLFSVEYVWMMWMVVATLEEYIRLRRTHKGESLRYTTQFRNTDAH